MQVLVFVRLQLLGLKRIAISAVDVGHSWFDEMILGGALGVSNEIPLGALPGAAAWAFLRFSLMFVLSRNGKGRPPQ